MNREQAEIVREILKRTHDDYLTELTGGNSRPDKNHLLKRINAIRDFLGQRRLRFSEVSQ